MPAPLPHSAHQASEGGKIGAVTGKRPAIILVYGHNKSGTQAAFKQLVALGEGQHCLRPLPCVLMDYHGKAHVKVGEVNTSISAACCV